MYAASDWERSDLSIGGIRPGSGPPAPLVPAVEGHGLVLFPGLVGGQHLRLGAQLMRGVAGNWNDRAKAFMV